MGRKILRILPDQAIIGAMNVRFVLRGSALGLSIALFIMALLFVTGPGRQWLPFPPVVPAVPDLTAPPGSLPTSSGGLIEWARYGDDVYHPVGRGFLFRLPSGEVVGVTTAHSLSFTAQPRLRSIALAQHETSQRTIEFETFRGDPGEARTGEDMSVDYVLLNAPRDQSLDPALILDPDPRGLPQPGERVALYSIVYDRPRIFPGAVLSADPSAIWVVMDEDFDPAGLSGSPFVSQHSGKVIGMAIATTRRGGKVLLGLHPIGSLVQKAQAAHTFVNIAAFRR